MRGREGGGWGGVLQVTDYVEESLWRGREEVLLGRSGWVVGEVEMNPWRRPDACVARGGHGMPTCGGNAFRCFVDCCLGDGDGGGGVDGSTATVHPSETTGLCGMSAVEPRSDLGVGI